MSVSYTHLDVYKRQTGECQFGNLEPIYLPPHAVSIPRTEVPMEAIIGVQVRRKETMSRKENTPCSVQVLSMFRLRDMLTDFSYFDLASVMFYF